MPNNSPNIFNHQAITAEVFLKDYWQQRPYLFRQTDLPLAAVPDRQQLFDLAAQDGVQSRIIYRDDWHRYRAVYDEPDAWSSLTNQHPTLLVSDIEKWCPEAMAVLSALPFIKAWRFDDLMVSYAPTGASVGAHIDQYDVFLVQVRGQRQWSYDDTVLTDYVSVEDSDLAVIADYKPDNTQVLSPGDVLYLPPRIAHHGISLDDDCLTLSVGLRSPSDAELLTAIADHVAQELPESARLLDAGDEINATASISHHEINHLRQQIARLQRLPDTALADIFGQFMTAYRLLDAEPEYASASDSNQLQKNPITNFAYYAIDAKRAHLYINGEQYSCSLTFAQYLCDRSTVSRQQLQAQSSDEQLLQQLLAHQHLIAAQ